MTAWATVVAERLGFSRQEALSIGDFLSYIRFYIARIVLLTVPQPIHIPT